MPTYKRCLLCGSLIEKSKRTTRKIYCSNKCKQRAYRIYHAEKLKAERKAKREATRPTITYTYTCRHCGEKTYARQQHHQRYCSNACKQAAYRKRKALALAEEWARRYEIQALYPALV